MKNKLSTWCASAGAAITFGVLGGVAIPVTVTDNFNNNVVGQGLWDVRQFGGVTLAETGQRLEFSANGATGVLSFAALEVEHWGANFKRDFEIEFDYKLRHGDPSGSKTIFLGVGLALVGQWPQTITGVACGLIQNSDGLFLGWIEYENGVEIDSELISISNTAGQVNVEWDKSDDRLTVRRNEQAVTLDGLFAEHGEMHGSDPMLITIGAATTNGNITFIGSRTWVDNFQFQGVKRQR